ncbi:FAD-dependent oxidoreductase, partial [Rhodococcus sp. NPDC059968]|uniref:FAD-binding oxidoreductase n=1 Tax=Rhodococcus sp. NPDC059968 TaxID=3347017 RepID=UPI0036730E9A
DDIGGTVCTAHSMSSPSPIVWPSPRRRASGTVRPPSAVRRPPSAVRRPPSCNRRPATVEEIQSILRIANETSVPVWFNSQGRNNGYGGAAAADRGTVVVDLRRMNKVLEINDELGYTVVEPGVSFGHLMQYRAVFRLRRMFNSAVLGLGGD